MHSMDVSDMPCSARVTSNHVSDTAFPFVRLSIGVTGNMLKEDVDHFKSKGADSVLPKPLNMELLNRCWYDLSKSLA